MQQGSYDFCKEDRAQVRSPLSKGAMDVKFSGAHPERGSCSDEDAKQPPMPSTKQTGDSEPGVLARACRCLSTFCPMAMRGRAVENNDRVFQDFFHAMLGEAGTVDFTSDGAMPSTQVNSCSSFCLEELSGDSLYRMLHDAVPHSDSSQEEEGNPNRREVSNKGLVIALQPYLDDLLTRRRGFRAVADLLAAQVDDVELDGLHLPRVFTELTAKDLFLALLVASPPRKRASLATAYAALRVPVPIIIRAPVGHVRSEPMTAAVFDLLRELACVPRLGRELVVSLGTKRTVGAGKTTLLGNLALAPMDEDELDIRPCGPMHLPSCDLFCTDMRRWIADTHGHWSGVDDFFRAAILAMILWGRAVCIVHSGLGDFHSKTNMPVGELADLLSAIGSLTSMPAGGSIGTTATGGSAPIGSSGVVILLRDTGTDAQPPQHIADSIEQEFGVVCLGILPVNNYRSFTQVARSKNASERLRTSLEERFSRAWSGEAETPCLEELLRINTLLTECVLGRLRVAGSTEGRSLGTLEGRWSFPSMSPETVIPPGGPPSRRSALGDKFVSFLDDAHKSGGTVSKLFPLSLMNRRLTALRRADSGVGPSEAAAPVGSTQREQLKFEEDRANARSEEMRRLEGDLSKAECSAALTFFQKVVGAGDPRAISEMGLYLEEWKEPRLQPLLDRHRELLDRSSENVSVEDSATKSSDELKQVASQLDQLDFSMESFWVELELLAEHQQKGSVTTISPKAKDCMRVLVEESTPFQILHGQPLTMAGNFLRNILEVIGVANADPRGIFVVSVIGAQSSAKSTLLNFLFGCGFAVRAGRCTRGLYASYFHPEGGPPMLVLDSEGLLSLGSEGAVFDGQIALMCMSCSHLVLVNHKGELSRQLQDLLEVCLFAMKHLRLTRLQPRLVFVLRDQHDRSNTVHEDMLKQMRNHLEEAAQTLGSPLSDLIRLDGTAVFLLPSAVTSELRQGKEVCWTSELFSREVLRLRGEIFRWLHEDAKMRASSGPPEFNSLTHWYDYAATVWETLVQFGGRLLHYKTIHDIELRRELADVAKTAVQDALEGSSSSDGIGVSVGFHSKAQEMVDTYVSRVQASPSKLDLDTTDMELGRALACLRDDFISQLEDLFDQRTSDPRFSATAKEHARKQIRTPIEWAFENHLYTWKLHLKRASDEQAMHALWIHFTGVLNRHLANSGHRSTVSEAESRSIFESEWHAYETQYLERHKMLLKDWQTLAHEVTLLFNHAVTKLQHETGALALLKEVGPQLVSLPPEKRREAGMPCIIDQTDEEWEEQYFCVGWWAAVRKRGLALLQNNGLNAADPSNLIQRMKEVVQKGLEAFQVQIITRGALDEATAAEGLRHISGVVLPEIESRLLNDWSVGTLKRPQILHALHVSLRLTCIEALVAVEANKQEQAMKDLNSQKAHVEEHFLLIIQTNKGDVERAANFAKMYHRTLTNWMDHEVTCLTAEVRSQVLQEMPDPQKSSERAFQLSFGAQNWPDVLEYVLDMNAYLEKVFLTLFHQRKRSYVGAARSRLEKRITATYRLLQDIAKEWARKKFPAAPTVDVTAAPTTVTPECSVLEFKNFITTHCEHVPGNAEKADAHRQLAERLPATADFPIGDTQLFAEAFQARVGDFIESPEMAERLAIQLDKALQEQSVRAWSLIRGCCESCPLCGSKCDIVGEHARHHCAHHLFPAFHGWMDRTTGLPSFNHCLGCNTREGTYECKDGVWRNLEDYLNKDHPSWMPFLHDQAASERDIPLLRAAWVNCREPLLEYFSPMADSCPEDWRETHEDGRALTVADLKVAKDNIRKLRDHTWKPPED